MEGPAGRILFVCIVLGIFASVFLLPFLFRGKNSDKENKKQDSK